MYATLQTAMLSYEEFQLNRGFDFYSFICSLFSPVRFYLWLLNAGFFSCFYVWWDLPGILITFMLVAKLSVAFCM